LIKKMIRSTLIGSKSNLLGSSIVE